MKIKSTQHFCINQAYIPYIEYGMDSADDLSDDEIAQIDAFLEALPQPGDMDYCMFDSVDLRICEIGGLYASCVQAKWTEWELQTGEFYSKDCWVKIDT